MRAFCTFTGVSAWFFAIAAMPLAEAVALHFTLPVFGLILSALILREHVTHHRWVTVGIGFLGVLIILRPGIAVFDYMALAVFLSAIGYAGGDICTKMLSRTEPSRLIVLNLNIWLIVFAAIPSAMDWYTPTLADLPMILVMGVTAWAAHMCLAQAMKCADASIVIPMEFIRLPITAFSAYFFFAEVPGIWAMIGAAVIFFGTWRHAMKEGGQ
jgi:drug/metabolite transporter (DMT)-like permease